MALLPGLTIPFEPAAYSRLFYGDNCDYMLQHKFATTHAERPVYAMQIQLSSIFL